MRPKTHRISIPTILNVGKGNLENVGYLIGKKGFTQIVLFLGEGIKDLFGAPILDSLAGEGINILKLVEDDNIDLENIMRHYAYALPELTQAVVGAGGGKVLDLAKYVAFLNNLPYISIPTSASHDGFASSSSSLLYDGRRVSVPARIPFGIIVDIDVIKSSPEKFIFSGIGDLISKITAVYDWQFEEKNEKAVIDDFAVMIAKKSVNSIVRMESQDIREDFFLKELVDSLTMSGIAMEIAQTSAPASGSEHLISHALDKFVAHPQQHGIQVGIATYIMSKVQDHRYQRVIKFLNETGFFSYVKTLALKTTDFEKAIELAPSIKPGRYTYLHIEENRRFAQRLLFEDEILKDILV